MTAEKKPKLKIEDLLELIKGLESRINELEIRNFHSDFRSKIAIQIKKSKE